MKTINFLYMAGFSILIGLFSCTVEKRHYMSGYHIEWHNGNKAGNNHSASHASKSGQFQNEQTAIQANHEAELQESAITDMSITASVESPIGKVEPQFVFRAKAATEPVAQLTPAPVAQPHAVDAKQKSPSKQSAVAGGKSQLAALLLCLFIGLLGIHRFYLGYVGIGIIQLLTLGGCGIWTLIDLILIITGDLGPKNGSYDKTL